MIDVAHTTSVQPAVLPFSGRAGSAPDSLQAWEGEFLNRYVPRHVPAVERIDYARRTTLRQFYQDCLDGRWEPLGRKAKRSRGTAQKDRQSLSRWEQHTPRPDDWSGDWPGPSLAFLERVGGQYLDEFYERMLHVGLSPATVKSTRGHLTVIINHAHRVRAIERTPISRPLEQRDPKTRIYSSQEATTILNVLAPHPQLHAAMWLILHAGPRAVDTFRLRWSAMTSDHLGRRLIEFESLKTHKLQAVPISDETFSVLDALPRENELVFGRCGNLQSKDPEKSYQARVRNTLVKNLLASAGIVVERPWQIARATCNERYESHRPGVGEFILGHSCRGVNARSYRQPTEAVHEAVRTLPPYTQAERQRMLF